MFKVEWVPKEIKIVARDETGLPKIKEDGTFETKIAPAVFKGIVILIAPKHTDRIKFARQLTTKIKEGELVEDNEMTSSEKIYEFARKHVDKVDLVRIEDGKRFDSFEMLEYDKDGESIIAQIGNDLLEGLRLGKT